MVHKFFYVAKAIAIAVYSKNMTKNYRLVLAYIN